RERFAARSVRWLATPSGWRCGPARRWKHRRGARRCNRRAARRLYATGVFSSIHETIQRPPLGVSMFPGLALVVFLALAFAFATSPAACASELQDAIEANSVAQVKTLLSSGANPNEQSIYGGP